MQKVYITGTSLISALGNDKKAAVENVKKMTSDEKYHFFLKKIFQEKNFYSIEKNFKTKSEKFFSVIEKAVNDCIAEAQLTEEEVQDLHIFLGSTSMNISIIEEENAELLKVTGKYKLKDVGYGNIGNFVEELIKSKHNSTLVQSACTSSVNAFSYAANLIKNNKIKRALVVGFELFNSSTFEGFNSLMLLSKIGQCKPLDKESDGIVLGEGCSAIILDSKRVSQNDFEWLASNSSFDNYSMTNSHPEGDITFNCMKKVIEKANLKLEEITCLKAHSTGSPASSLSEARAIDKLLKYYKSTTSIVSLKPFIGHTLGACGTNEIALLCECIKNGFIPKTFGFNEKYDDVSFDILTQNKEVKTATVLFHYVGFGGSNSSIILSNK